MPQMTDITIKKADGTTDVVYKMLQPSSGDKNPARWAPVVTGPRASAPTFEVAARKQAQSRRAVDGSYLFPVYRDVAGVATFVDVVRLRISGVIPSTLTDAEVNEAVSQGFNLMNHVLTRNQFKEGYAAT